MSLLLALMLVITSVTDFKTTDQDLLCTDVHHPVVIYLLDPDDLPEEDEVMDLLDLDMLLEYDPDLAVVIGIRDQGCQPEKD